MEKIGRLSIIQYFVVLTQAPVTTGKLKGFQA